VAPSPTMEAERLVAELNASTGPNLHLTGQSALGEVRGAVYVRWPDGRDGVVTPSSSPVGWLTFIGDVLALARSRGARTSPVHDPGHVTDVMV
jgi:hypothetical protein